MSRTISQHDIEIGNAVIARRKNAKKNKYFVSVFAPLIVAEEGFDSILVAWLWAFWQSLKRFGGCVPECYQDNKRVF